MIDIMRAKTANVAVVAFDGLALFEFAIACEVFGEQYDVELGVPWYDLSICALDAAPVRTDRGLQLAIPFGLDRLASADTVIVPPAAQPDAVPTEVLDALRDAHARGARIASLCTGAAVLAAAGLLAGRRVTTHWAESAELARRYPDVEVDPDVLYIDDGDILTSAGSAASLDLCLHLVRCDHGVEVAAALARELVVPPFREGGQAQFIRTPLPDPDTDTLFRDTLAWVLEHLGEEITVADLARRCAMSPRTFARRFVDTTGTTPYHWLVRQRVQLAQQLLETTDEPVDTVAARSGFVTAGNLRKHFGRVARTTPLRYRTAFRQTA